VTATRPAGEAAGQVLITGTIAVDPERRGELLAAVRPLVERTRLDEPGCLEYAFMADTVADDVVVVLERWADEQSLAAHFEHPNMVATKRALREHGSRASTIVKYRVDQVRPVKDGSGAYRADFGPH
jgi:quinol monooxygenase YgiN